METRAQMLCDPAIQSCKNEVEWNDVKILTESESWVAKFFKCDSPTAGSLSGEMDSASALQVAVKLPEARKKAKGVYPEKRPMSWQNWSFLHVFSDENMYLYV